MHQHKTVLLEAADGESCIFLMLHYLHYISLSVLLVFLVGEAHYIEEILKTLFPFLLSLEW